MAQNLTGEQQAKLEKIIRDALNLGSEVDVKTLTSQGNPAWDSLRHVALCLRVQNEFRVRFDGAELVKMRSYDDIVKTLESHL